MNVRRIKYARLQMRLLRRRKIYTLAVRLVSLMASWRGWQIPMVRHATLAIVLPLFWLALTTPLNEENQLIFALINIGAMFFLRNISGRYITQVLIVLSLVTSTRYLYWRITETMVFDNFLNGFFGTGLFLAELYAWIVLALGFFQAAWPLERKPIPLDPDSSTWPTVDIFIPSYNEPLSVVRTTVFGALAIDWPKDKINVYVLDDGRRDEFRLFCEEVGVGHITRTENNHAKAGNINAALTKTNGEFVAIFDCDHVPTRTFLQVTMAWFLKDKKLGMLQTPHHFFNPDPFEKNLKTFKTVPNEGELFYGLLQDGNDLWNATFFCGSCAILRRKAILDVGGIAVETVTEDAHTAMKMHKLGYTTAYLAVPQAAGFATESLGGHVGQRIRWARGMAQIFRIDNPFLVKNLELPQRFCYANAMLHFFYGLPRIVFLTAPLAYLFFSAEVIQASAYTIALYAIPHLMHANITNSRIQGEFRHSFWAEVYESVLAWYIFRPTLIAVINPKLGKFNVTAKGGVNEKEYFDWNIAKPYLILMTLALAGFVVGLLKIFFAENPDVDTLTLNLIWTIYNLTILGASVAVANESQQLRGSHRVPMKIPAALRSMSGRSYVCETSDYSDGGVGLMMPTDLREEFKVGDAVRLALHRGEDEFVFDAVVTMNRGERMGVKFSDMNVKQSIDFVQCTFSRADTWVVWSDGRKLDKPMVSLKLVLMMGGAGFKILFNKMYEGKTLMFKRISTSLFNKILSKKS
jgi:cellulose synthase (UDP-forming)